MVETNPVIDEKYLIKLYSDHMGKSFYKYSLEVYMAMKKVVKYYDSSKGPVLPYAVKILNRYIRQSHKNETRQQIKVETSHSPPDSLEDALLLKQDIVRNFSLRDYHILYQNLVESVPVRMIARQFDLSPDATRYRIEQMQEYLRRNKYDKC